LIYLVEQQGARPKARNTTGLYHLAILVPSRVELARSLARLIRSGNPLGGHSDHLVSEALYLTDPDGNGIEIYRDRPRSEWKMNGAQVQMATLPIDLQALLREQADDNAPPATVPNGTTMGHIHLQVADIGAAARFYNGILGFDIMLGMPTALFISAGGYHHHIGLNTWESAGGPQGAPDAAGLRQATIDLPNAEALADVKARLKAANVPASEESGGLVTHDQDQNRLLLRVV
ncbi:MAG: Glyoxalase/bleomycin resistance protein/dioxygenase, partial [Chloroflexi bacterium]|nr:Glyoxalase/bleomycin resistance protein/dioxygenase [Chloroflexota bacterium]